MPPDQPDEAALNRAADILAGGGLVAFPTETVYGLGGDALDPAASEKIYAAKGRPSDNPLIVHISDFDALLPLVEEEKKTLEKARKLSEVFWPGPLTMILHKSSLVPKKTTGGLETVAIRMPSHPVARRLIKLLGERGGELPWGYIAAPSANRSGRPSPTLGSHCREDLDGRVEMIIDAGPVGIGVESTIIDLTEEKPTLLRPGFVTPAMLEEVLGGVDIDRTILDGNSPEKPKAPGMKYRHYAPRGEMVIVEGKMPAVTTCIRESVHAALQAGISCGILCTEETKDLYSEGYIRCAGSRENEEELARSIFEILRSFDEQGIEKIWAESLPACGVGMAVMNRLMKAAGHRVIQV